LAGAERETKTGDEAPGVWPDLRAWLKSNPQHLTTDHELLTELGLKQADNVVAFGPAALSRLEEAVKRETGARRVIEHVARANFSAQAQTHVTVLDLLEARNHSDLATRLDHACQARFGLATATICLERPGTAPFGWRLLEPDSIARMLGEHGLQRLGPSDYQGALFGSRGAEVNSMALVRMALWSGNREALVAFGSADPEGFTPDMGAELIAFVTRVVERVADRWPILDPQA